MGNVTPITAARPRVLEFFAGIGLARMGLEEAGFHVAWANDYEPDKKAMYDAQFGASPDHAFALGDIGKVKAADLPRDASLAWASSPCTDLSLAGSRAGLAGLTMSAATPPGQSPAPSFLPPSTSRHHGGNNASVSAFFAPRPIARDASAEIDMRASASITCKRWTSVSRPSRTRRASRHRCTRASPTGPDTSPSRPVTRAVVTIGSTPPPLTRHRRTGLHPSRLWPPAPDAVYAAARHPAPGPAPTSSARCAAPAPAA